MVALRWGEKQVRAAEDGPCTVPYDELPENIKDSTAPDMDYLRMSDEDVEKAVAELKATLRKNATSR